MKIKILVLVIILTLGLLTACATAPLRSDESVAFDEATSAEMAPAQEPAEGGFEGSVAGESFDNVNMQYQDSPQRLIIRTGDVTIVVEDSESTARDIAFLADSLDGWLVSSDLYESNGFKRGSVTIRVPADQFDVAVAEIKSLALEVRSESTSSQDVTEEYVDLESRLENLEATADRVRGFLDEARNVEDALDVNRELSRLEEEIEVIKGRMQYLSQSAAFSTLTVNLVPDEPSQPVEIGGWRPEGVAKDAIEALVSTLQTVANVAIWGGIFCLPIALLVGVPLFFVGRYLYRRRQRSNATGEPGPEAAENSDPEAGSDGSEG